MAIMSVAAGVPPQKLANIHRVTRRTWPDSCSPLQGHRYDQRTISQRIGTGALIWVKLPAPLPFLCW